MRYRPDWPEARRRLAHWWNGGDIGRAILLITARRAEPHEIIPPVPAPSGVLCPHYSTLSLEHRIFLARQMAASCDYFGEAAPSVAAGDLAPNCLALYLGCEGVEMPGTVWCKPCMFEPERDLEALRFREDEFHWKFSLDAIRGTLEAGAGSFLIAFPDLIEGLDTLEAMRGGMTLLSDVMERPEWVRACMRRITDLYFHYYDILYDLMRDEVGGSVYWTWAPGRVAKLQCDCSAMIGPSMFREFMQPVLKEMTERISYSIYHWDGPGAIKHHDVLLSIPKLDVIQWTPGAGERDSVVHPDWFPLYHKTLDSGKRLFLAGVPGLDGLRALKREFGSKTRGMLLTLSVPDRAQALACIGEMEA
jgi:hypothetical protein